MPEADGVEQDHYYTYFQNAERSPAITFCANLYLIMYGKSGSVLTESSPQGVTQFVLNHTTHYVLKHSRQLLIDILERALLYAQPFRFMWRLATQT